MYTSTKVTALHDDLLYLRLQYTSEFRQKLRIVPCSFRSSQVLRVYKVRSSTLYMVITTSPLVEHNLLTSRQSTLSVIYTILHSSCEVRRKYSSQDVFFQITAWVKQALIMSPSLCAGVTDKKLSKLLAVLWNWKDSFNHWKDWRQTVYRRPCLTTNQFTCSQR